MFNISPNKIITCTRGDSFEFPVFLNAGTVLEPIRYTLQNNDTLVFAVCEPNQPFERAIIKKVITTEDVSYTDEGDVIVKFNTCDTEFLLPGVYYYEIKLRTIYKDNWGEVISEDVSTIIGKRKFIILN